MRPRFFEPTTDIAFSLHWGKKPPSEGTGRVETDLQGFPKDEERVRELKDKVEELKKETD